MLPPSAGLTHVTSVVIVIMRTLWLTISLHFVITVQNGGCCESICLSSSCSTAMRITELQFYEWP